MSQTPHMVSMSSFTPVSRGKILLAELLDDWTFKSNEASQEKVDDEHPTMVPRCSPLSPVGKSKGPLHSTYTTTTAAKRLKLSPDRDVNSNKMSPGPLSLYKKDGGGPGTLLSGDNFSTSPVFRSKVLVSSLQDSSPVTSNSIPQSKMDKDIQMSPASSSSGRISGDTRQSPFQTSTGTPLHSVKNYRQNSSGAAKQMEDSSIGFFLGMMSRSPIPLQQALGSSKNCAVIHMLESDDLLDMSKEKVDRLMGNLQQRMLRLKDIRKHGLVHWGGEEYKWTCLGEKEEHQTVTVTRSDWRNDWKMVEGVGSRTRAASRGKYYFEESAGAGVNEVVENETGYEDIYDYDEGDEGIKKQTRNISKKMHPFIDESDEEEDNNGWLLKPKKGKGKGRGRGRRLGGGNGRLGKKCDRPSNPGVDTFFGTVDEHSQEEVASIAELVISEDAENYDKTTATVSPATASWNRVLLGKTGEYSRTRIERRGTCPMCSKEMGMSTLERHAPECQG